MTIRGGRSRGEETSHEGSKHQQYQTQWSERGPNTSGNMNNISCCIGRYRGYTLLPKRGPISRNWATPVHCPLQGNCMGHYWRRHVTTRFPRMLSKDTGMSVPTRVHSLPEHGLSGYFRNRFPEKI